VSVQPIWITVALCAIGLFLADVGVRRVRIDPRAMWLALRRGMGKGRERANQQMGSLKEARERAQRGINQTGQAMADKAADKAAAKAAAARTKETASVKFEASDDELRKARKSDGAVFIDKTEKKDQPGTPPAAGADPKKPEEGGMSRLKKARKRAQDEFGEE